MAFGTGHVVICTGKEINKNTRPTNAGLKIFLPNPPNDIFPIPIETMAPITMIHHGKLLGTLNASRIPVIIADPSVTVTAVFN